jgi:acyl-CoA synthetase (AMP-forming)/AMP-acid ligase II
MAEAEASLQRRSCGGDKLGEESRDVETQTIPGLALAAAESWPDQNAITCGDVRLSFAELADRMMTAAAAFVAAGLQPGERVCLWAQNGWQWIVACLGLQAAGGVLVPLNTRFRAAEAGYIVSRSGATMAVASEHFLGAAFADMLEGLDAPALRRVVRLGDAKWAAFLDEAHSAAREEAYRRVRALGPDDISDIMFTSGTTGDPKGAVATHGQTVATARLWAKATTLREGDRFLILWPFFHCSGYKAGWVVDLLVGAATLPEPVLDAGALLEKVAREQVTFLPGPPTLFQTLLADPGLDRAKLASVRVSITGASAVPPSLIEAMRADLGIPVVLSGYGLTETCGTVTMTNAEDPPEIVTTSCGRAIDGIELACVDETGRPVPTGEAGEVIVRGMNVMKGYLDDPAATAEAIDADGWLHTGDIGTLDARGYLRITDRMKDIFIVGGFNCYPAEIEKMLMAHPAILQVAVTGIPDERMGEVGKAFVVLKPGADLDAEALTAWSRERMANFKVPRAIAFVPDLPTNATGKVQKFKLPN